MNNLTSFYFHAEFLGLLITIAAMTPNAAVANPGTYSFTHRRLSIGACGRWCVGDPINLGGGNMYEESTDYQSGGAFPLIFFRAYNSGLRIESKSRSPDGGYENLGRGWVTNLDKHLHIALVPLPPGSTVPGPCIINGMKFFCPPADPTSNRPYQINAFLWNSDGSQENFIYQGTGAPAIGTHLKNDPRTTGLLQVESVSAANVVTEYLYLRDDGTKERYDGIGKLMSVTDENGLTQIYHYDAHGNLTRVTGPFHRTLTLRYDNQNRVKTLINPAGGAITYQYNALGNLVSVRYPDHSRLRYVYGNHTLPHALTSIIDQDGHRYVMWSYDALGRAVTSALADGTDQVHVVYNADGSTTAIEPGGPTRHLTFKSISLSEQMATTSAPCDSCNIKSITYDNNGFISTETDFQGQVTHFKTDPTGLELSRTEGVGTKNQKTVETQWNQLLRKPVSMKTQQNTLGFSYDRNGRLLAMGGVDKTNGTLHRVRYKYDRRGLLLSETDPDGATTKFSYDTQGNLASVTDSQRHTVRFPRYDANGYPLTIIGPTGIRIELTYDAMQRLVSRTMAGAKTVFRFDQVGQLVKMIAPNEAYIEYHYDVSHRLISMNDNLGDTVDYKLDARGNEIGEHVYNKRLGTITPTQILTELNKVLKE